MESNDFKAQYLSYNDIKGAAKSFLQEHNAEEEIPVDIELIVEKDFGIDIIPLELEKIFGIDAFTSLNRKEIRIDRNTVNNNINRLRFSLAHEIAHVVLHKNIFDEVYFNSLDDFKTVQDEIPSDEYKWLEWQADSFAGLILTPPVELEKQVELNVQKLVEAGYTIRDGSQEKITSYISIPIAKHFVVSQGTIKARIIYDKLNFGDYV